MPLGWAMAGSALLGFLGSSKQAAAQKDAAQMQADEARRQAEQQRQMFDILNAQQAPQRGAGYSSLNQILAGLTGEQPIYDLQGKQVGTGAGTGLFTRMPTAEDIQNMPGYQFAVGQGIGATRQGMNVAGGGSNVDRAAQKFAMDYALTTALPQYEAQRTGIFNRLASIANLGQTAQQQTQQAGLQTSGNLAQLGIGAAGALGAGQIGAAQAYGQGLGGIGNAGLLYSLLRPSSGAGASSVPYLSSLNSTIGGAGGPVDYGFGNVKLGG